MSNALKDIAQQVNNPVLGAYLIWQFVSEYQKEQKMHTEVHPSLAFLVLPILFHEDTRSIVTSTQRASGLHAAISKLYSSDKKLTDISMVIQNRVDIEKERTFESLLMALDSGLLFINKNTGHLIRSTSIKSQTESRLAKDITPLVRGAKKLGFWFSQLSINEINKIIKVGF